VLETREKGRDGISWRARLTKARWAADYLPALTFPLLIDAFKTVSRMTGSLTSAVPWRVQPLLVRVLNAPDLTRVVPHLHPGVLHRVIQICGLEDCADLVALATPDQLAHVLDVDISTRLFVLTLGYSRKSVRLLVWRSTPGIAVKRAIRRREPS